MVKVSTRIIIRKKSKKKPLKCIKATENRTDARTNIKRHQFNLQDITAQKKSVNPVNNAQNFV